MKKTAKFLICLSMVFAMVVTSIPTSALAAEGNKQENEVIDDYEDTTLYRDVESIEMDANAAGDLEDFTTAPIFDVMSGKLILPRIEGYTVALYGSDRKEVIDLQGNVTRPLETVSVKLLYKITSKQDGSVITTQKNAQVKIPARELTFTEDNARPQVIPALREWAGSTGDFQLKNTSRIVVGSPVFQETAETFQQDLKAVSGKDVLVVQGDEQDVLPGDFYLVQDETEASLLKEGYYLEIGGKSGQEDYTTIRAYDKIGAYYGTISILQILKQKETHDTLPKGMTRDYPMFEKRGMMFDVARKYIPMEYLNDLMKQMSWYKLNTLSLHLNDCDIWNSLSADNQGEPQGFFRLESEKYPEIVSKDHYTKEEFRNLQYDAMDLGIHVIPEIDSPGHALAFTTAWPELTLSGNKKYLDVTKPETLERIKSLFDEYIDGYEGEEPTFVGQEVNIGTDEYKAGGSLKESFRSYVDALLKYVKSKGKEPVFWGSLKENAGTTPVTNDATMFAWYQGYADAKKSLDEGYRIISMEDLETYIVPGGGYYSNQFGQGKRLYNSWMPNDNSGWANHPAPDGHPNMVGGQFAVWNDFIGNGISVEDISYRIQHNLYVIAEKCWSGKEKSEAGISFEEEQALAAKLADAPNADFLYKNRVTTENNEVIKLDATTENQVAAGSGAAITKVSNVTEEAEGKNGKALQFNGGSSYLETDLPSTGFDWTMAMWIRPSSDNAQDAVLMEGKTGVLKLNGTHIEYTVEQYTHSFAVDIPAEAWTHIALQGTYEGVALYVNGKHIDTLKGKPYPNYNCNSGNNSWNGDYPNNGTCRTTRSYETLMLPTQVIGSKTNAFKGQVDELQIYNTQLTEAQIRSLAGVAEEKEYVNVALDKNVQSKNPVNAGNVAANAVDGKLSPTWEFALNATDPYEIEIPLQADEDVNHIILKQRLWGSELTRIKNIKIEAITNGVGTVLYEGVVNGKEAYQEEGRRYADAEFYFDTTKADAIRFTILPKGTDENSLVNIAEIEMYGTKEKTEAVLKNLAFHQPVAASGTEVHDGRFTPEMVVDGSTASSSRWSSNTAAASSTADLDAWLYVDLGASKKIDTVIINWEDAYATEYKIQVSNTGTAAADFHDVAHITDGKGGIATIQFDACNARYVKFQGVKKRTDNQWILGYSFYELEVYGDEVEGEEKPDPTAPIPHSTMSAFADDENSLASGIEGPAYLAIDDNTNSWWHTNYQPQSNPPLPHSITLDLKQAKVVDTYAYTPRPGAGNGTITSYELQVSLDNVNYYTIRKGEWELNAAVKTVEFEPVTARYIRLIAYAGKQNFASAAELNVYAADKATLETFYLTALLNKVKGLHSDEYMSDSFAPLAAAMSEAEKALQADTQAAIDAAYESLKKVYQALVKRGDKNDLRSLVEDYQNLQEENYTPGSVAYFKAALAAALAVLNGSDDVLQEDIDKVHEGLENAYSALANIGALQEASALAKQQAALDYTADSKAALQDAIMQAENVLKDNEASLYDVKTAENALLDAIYDLVFDRSILNASIKAYEDKDYTQYTLDSWNVYQVTYETAKAVADNDNVNVEEATRARVALDAAANALKLRGDRKPLQELLKEIGDLHETDYSAASWLVYQAALHAANAVIEDNSNASQEDVDNLLAALKDAVENLEPRQGDKSELKALLQLYKEEDYTIDSWKMIASFIKEGNAVLANENATQEEINTIISAIKEKASLLVARADLTELQAAVTEYSKLQADEYTKETWDVFAQALAAAKTMIEDASNTTQVAADAALRKLQEAKAALRAAEIPESNLDVILHTAINKALELKDKGKLANLAEKVVANFNRRLDEAVLVYEKEDATDQEKLNAWKNLAEAMHYLNFSANKTELKALLTEYDAIDLTLYKDDRYKTAFINALAVAKVVLESHDVLDASITAAYDELISAKSALQWKDDIQTTLLEYYIKIAMEAIANADLYDQQAASWIAFQKALTAAKEALDAKVSQDAVNQATQVLADAYENIRLIANEETLKQLEDFIRQMELLDKTAYRKEDLAFFEKTLRTAKALSEQKLFTKTEYDKMMAAITKAYDMMKNNKLPVQTPNTSVNQAGTKTPTGDTTKTAEIVFLLLLAGGAMMLLRKKTIE